MSAHARSMEATAEKPRSRHVAYYLTRARIPQRIPNTTRPQSTPVGRRVDPVGHQLLVDLEPPVAPGRHENKAAINHPHAAREPRRELVDRLIDQPVDASHLRHESRLRLATEGLVARQ
eukprot:5621139-Prymnesium_polylepis.1